MKRVYVKEEVCIGCGLCRVFCQVEQSQSKDLIKAFKKETPRPLPRVHVDRNVEVSFPIQCRQCDEPWCVYSCLTGAMCRDPATGMVSVDVEKCVGCWTCMVACVINCPNEALVYAESQAENHNVES
jgi:carbon-monoxide dehydrogenase iron sulfur subunit